MKILSLVCALTLSTTVMAAPNKNVRCTMDWDGADLTFDFKFSTPAKSKVVLAIVTPETPAPQRVTLPNQVDLTTTGRDVTVGFFMGSLTFQFPNKIFTSPRNKKVTVNVHGSSEGSESDSPVECKAVK